ncbi:MAG: class I SAM-dependent methyltransferase [Caldilineaceae bacterium]|nr:class I SAM-dependent methyltransferase [Caldilineaceae bacterium]
MQQLLPDRPNFFETGSPYLHHPLLTPERTAAEVDFVITRLQLPDRARILDVGCGFGRHSIELARRGFAVTAIDPAPAMVAAAHERAKAAGVSVEFQSVSGETFAAANRYAAAICLFTTLGQISATGENSALLGNIFAALLPGGRLIVELPQRAVAVETLKRHERFGGDDRYTEVNREFDPSSNTMSERFEVVDGDNRRDFLLRYRLFSRPEVERLLAAHGFGLNAFYADYAGAPLLHSSPTMIVVAHR